MYQVLLVPVDGSENARRTLAIVCKLAVQARARVHVLHVPEVLSHDTRLIWGADSILMDAPRDEVERAGKKIAEGARQEAMEHGVTDIDVSIQQGDPARVILEQASLLGVDAVILGSRGLSDIAGLMVDSVSRKVFHAADCEVITVHRP